jgi:hypothetical protein
MRKTLALLLLLAGCGTTSSPGTTADTASASDTAASQLRTLANCETKVGAGVPAFFQKYFRCADISMDGTDVVLKSTDLPPHVSPYWPATDPNHVAFDTQGGTRTQNPNTLKAQALTIRIPMAPVAKGLTITKAMVNAKAGDSAEEYNFGDGGAGGLALDGVAIFHGVAAPGDDIAQEAHTFDKYEGHPQNSGVYHYHSPSPGPLEVLAAAKITGIELYGVMCDGALLLGCTELDGKQPDGKDFDAQNGHVHDIAADGTTYFTQRYHTHLCPATFPADPYAPEIQYYKTCNGGGGQSGGPKACTSTADCAAACPPGSKGCTCADGQGGSKLCVPTCTSDADCPTGGPAFQCDTSKGTCKPK